MPASKQTTEPGRAAEAAPLKVLGAEAEVPELLSLPEGEANNYNTYDGTGGIRMGSFFRRLAIAWNVGDITKVPFSDDITADSVLLMRRNVRERVQELAPFLLFDADPYVVVGAVRSCCTFIQAVQPEEPY